jgi:hypothetical protein
MVSEAIKFSKRRFSIMTTAQQVLQEAASHIGYKESPPNSNNNKFGVWYGMNHQPWCAMFVSYCLYVKGLPLKITTDKGFAYCPFGVKWFKDKEWWHSSPQVGDLVFFDWQGDGVSDHVGFVEKVNTDGSITTIEGNTSVGNNSNGGEVMRRKRSGSIQGYGRPPYSPGGAGGTGSGDETPVHPQWPGRYIALTSPFMQGDDVLLWQRQMIHRGWTLTPDSIFNESDHDVLIKFQKEKGLEVDGKIGPMSWNAAWESPITSD